MRKEELEAQSEHIAAMLEERLGVKGRGLEAKIQKAGRKLPRWVRREAEQLVEAERMLSHPKLMMQADPIALQDAAKRCETFLKSVDPAERRKEALLGFLAVNSWNMLLVSVAFVAYLKWSGHL